jgi:alpha-amylase
MSVCFYFQVHQPYRLRHYHFLEIGGHNSYFDETKNKEIFRKVAEKCYLPANNLMLELLNKHPEFKISYSLSGVFLNQCMEYGSDVLKSFQELAKTKQVEFLAETYYHSLSFLYSKLEFAEQIDKHRQTIKKLFKVNPVVFRNTELIYNNELANFIQAMNFKGILAEGADHILDWRSPNYLYQIKQCALPAKLQKIARKFQINQTKTTSKLKLLLKNYKLSDDIAFRFSNRSWTEHPLTSEKFAAWIANTPGETFNLFMDYETFGEHQWADTGIFDFMYHLPEQLKNRNIGFKTPSETIKTLKPVGEIDIHCPVSWADLERDVSAWIGNEIQEAALREIYELEKIMRTKKGNFSKKIAEEQIDTWRKLQTSDQFYYMCTKHWADGDVHKYFSPYDSPYDAYITFMNVLSDFKISLDNKLKIM